METLLGLFTSGGFSAIFGGLTGVFQIWMKKRHEAQMHKQKMEETKINNEHDLALQDREFKSLEDRAKIEADSQMFVANAEMEGVVANAEIAGITAAMENDKKAYTIAGKVGKIGNFLFVMVDTLRGTIRPVVTLYGLIMLNIMMVQLFPFMEDLDKAELATLFYLVFNAIVYISVKTIVFWFGDRGKEIVNMMAGRK